MTPMQELWLFIASMIGLGLLAWAISLLPESPRAREYDECTWWDEPL